MTTVKASAENATVLSTGRNWFGEQLDLFTIPTLYKPAPASTTLNPTCTPDNTQLSASPHHGRQEAK